MSHARPNEVFVCRIPARFLFASSRAGACPQDFSIIVLPDTQIEVESFPQVFNSQMQWIAANKQARNIQFVLAEGDNVNNATSTAELQTLDAGFKLLDNAAIPYLLGIGNHDYNGAAPKVSRDLTGFNQFFGPSRYSGKAYFKGNFPDCSSANTYGIVTVDGTQFLMMTLEYRPTSASLDWAESILAANPNTQALVVVHSLLLPNGRRENLCDDQDMPAGNANGQEVWQRLRNHDNVIMAFGGHFTGGPASRRADLSNGGTLVNQMYADYQDFPNGGNGWLRILTFHPSSNTISVQTFSPFLNQFRTGTQDQFTVAYHNPSPHTASGSISGKVRAQSGCAAIAGAEVTAAGVSTTTASDGSYRLTVSPGTHSVTVSATGWNTRTQTEIINDSLDTQLDFYLSPCTPGTSSPSVTICTPINGATVTSPVTVTALTRDTNAVRFVQAYVDGVAQVTQTGASLDAQIPISPGTHRITVQAKDNTGAIFKQTINITVGAPPPPPPPQCTPGPVSPSVSICSPENGAVVTSPVRVLAASRDSVAVSFMQIYVDGRAVLTRSGATLDASVPIAVGTHRLTVQAKDVKGVIFKQSISITVR